MDKMKGEIKISPSILAGDFSCLGMEIKKVEKVGVDFFHIDVMDGVFVPNISIGFPVIESVKKITSVPLDVHLMIVEPEKYIERTAEIMKEGIISFHIESARHPHRILTQIKSYGTMGGIAMNPGTPLSSVEELLDFADVLVIMSVDPGFYGQKFIKEVIPKIERAKDMIEKKKCKTLIEVDGGVNGENIDDIIRAGADIIVAGAYIFKNENPVEAVREIRRKSKIYGK